MKKIKPEVLAAAMAAGPAPGEPESALARRKKNAKKESRKEAKAKSARAPGT
jgi:hypothetical protein